MGREVRRVPPDWQHPKDADGRFIPLLGQDYDHAVREWEERDLPRWLQEAELWAVGLVRTGGVIKTVAHVAEEAKALAPYRQLPDPPHYVWWAGDVPARPRREDYMPSWPDAACTHYMVYETVSEGTPVSSVFSSEEAAEQWMDG